MDLTDLVSKKREAAHKFAASNNYPPFDWKVESDHMEMKDFSDCSKMELEAIGRRYGLELDRRKKKETLIEELQEVLDDEIQIT